MRLAIASRSTRFAATPPPRRTVSTACSAAARAVFSASISVIAFWNEAATSATGTSPFFSSSRTSRSTAVLRPLNEKSNRSAGSAREPARIVRADKQAPDEPGPDRCGHGVDLGELPPRVAERLLGEDIERAQVLARRDLGDDAAGVLVDQLRCDDVRTDPPPVLDDRDAGLIARRLDREDPHPVSCSSALSFARRSRTGRSRSRSVHMMSASSLLSE